MKIIKHPNFKDWREWRYTGIGGSDAPSVMDSSPFMTKTELWAKKTERLISPPANHRMKRGRALEPLARGAYEKLTGIDMPAVCIQSDKNPFVLCSFDGLNLKVRGSIEAKCPGKTDHALALRGEIPNKYLWQLVHALMAADGEIDWIDYVSFDGEEMAPPIRFLRDPIMEARLLKEEKIMWECILKDTPPVIEKPKELKTFQERVQNVIQLRRKHD